MAEQEGFIPFRRHIRERLLSEMLRGVKGASSSEWKVLVMDELTVRVMSTSCKMADITDEGISLVEDLNKRRQPLPALDAVYFIQPTKDSIKKFMADMGGRSPLYRRAHVFFSSPIPRDLLQAIKGEPLLLPRVASMKEMNLELLTVDQQGFITDNEQVLSVLYGEDSEGSAEIRGYIEFIAQRLATVFSSLKESPAIRYKSAAKATANGQGSGRDLIPTKLAATLAERLNSYKASLPGFPQSETCTLLIVDRTVDTIAPIIHEWTYGAMCHDLLNLDGNKYRYEVTTSSGKMEVKDVILDEHDPIWVELRDLHIAEANLRLNEKMQHFQSKNKAAQIRLGGGQQEISTRDMQKMVQALPQYRDQLEKIGLHVHIATILNDRVQKEGLAQIGNVEQDMVFGDASSKELITIFKNKGNMTSEEKLRLLAIYATTHPEKLDATKRMQWQQLARLSAEDMNAVNNLEYLGVAVSKKQGNSGFSLKFGIQKPKRALRKDKTSDDEQWQLSRFYPLLQDVVEELVKGDLSKDDYPYLREPPANVLRQLAGLEAGSSGSPASSSSASTAASSRTGMSMRSNRTSNWATSKGRPSEGENSGKNSPLPSGASPINNNMLPKAKRIFVFVVGGMMRSEIRAMHKLSASTRREIVIGSTSVETPKTFLQKLRSLSTLDNVDL